MLKKYLGGFFWAPIPRPLSPLDNAVCYNGVDKQVLKFIAYAQLKSGQKKYFQRIRNGVFVLDLKSRLIQFSEVDAVVAK